MSYEEKTVVELRAICREKGLTISSHSKKLTKSELIEKLEKFQSLPKKEKVTEQKKCEEIIEEPHSKKTKEWYYENALELGRLVAFKTISKHSETLRMMTGKVVGINRKARKIRVETLSKDRYEIEFYQIKEIKIYRNWSRRIYNELKGIKENEESKSSRY